MMDRRDQFGLSVAVFLWRNLVKLPKFTRRRIPDALTFEELQRVSFWHRSDKLPTGAYEEAYVFGIILES